MKHLQITPLLMGLFCLLLLTMTSCRKDNQDNKEAGIHVNSTYEIAIQGQTSAGVTFQIPAKLYVLPTIQDGTQRNGVNPVEIGIYTDPGPIVGVAGALYFGTNTSLSSIVNSTLGASAIDVAFVDVNPSSQTVTAKVDGNVFGLPTARLETFNIYNITTSLFAQVHNILAGTVTVAFNGNNVQGTISLGGSSGFASGAITSTYDGTFTGTRIQ